MPLLSVKNLSTFFHTRTGTVRAVDEVSLSLDRGRVLGIVGESGCGKSVLCFSLIGLVPSPPGKTESGTAVFDGTDLLGCSPRQLRGIRGKRIAMIFQDPMTSLNPYLRVGDQLIEPLIVHEKINKKEAVRRGIAALQEVGIPDARDQMRRYPHEFSGGMRQRVMIAMALITEPDLVIADEPTTALDVTVQAQILALLRKLQRKHDTATIFVTHDMGVVADISDEVAVMYAGKIVERTATGEIFRNPKHPYTLALQQSIPARNPKGRELTTIPGSPPDLMAQIPGCAFVPRCRHAQDACGRVPANLGEVSPGHWCSCRRVLEHQL